MQPILTSMDASHHLPYPLHYQVHRHNNPFEIYPLAIGRAILVFIIWIHASEWKKVQYGKAIDKRNKGMIKWDTNEDSLTNASCYSFHFIKRRSYKSKNPECS